MSTSRLPSELFEQSWIDYKNICHRDGFVPLNRFCENRNVPVQRLYEWLRRRSISVKEFQAQFSDDNGNESVSEAEFVPVCMEKESMSRNEAFCVEGVRIDCPCGKMSLSVERMSLSAFSHVLDIVKGTH